MSTVTTTILLPLLGMLEREREVSGTQQVELERSDPLRRPCASENDRRSEATEMSLSMATNALRPSSFGYRTS